jgi:prevent-host-death family protein
MSDGITVQMNIAEAKAKLSELVARAEAGEEVIIARDGKPVVTLTPRATSNRPGPRRLGVWDRYGATIPEDLFLGPDPDIEAAVEAWETAPTDPSA